MTTRDTTKDGIVDDYEYYAELEREYFADEYAEATARGDEPPSIPQWLFSYF